MPLEFTILNPTPAAAANCGNQTIIRLKKNKLSLLKQNLGSAKTKNGTHI